MKPDNVYYLTANLFYDGTHWAVKNKIMKFVKEWLLPHIQEIPKLEKAEICLTYYHTSEGFDLDNKLYFWVKVLLDIMKTPTSAQILKSQEYNNEIITINSLKDDSVRFVPKINMAFERGQTALEIKITGRLANVQETLF